MTWNQLNIVNLVGLELFVKYYSSKASNIDLIDPIGDFRGHFSLKIAHKISYLEL